MNKLKFLKNKIDKKIFVLSFGGLVIIVAAYLFGFNVGSGNISFGSGGLNGNLPSRLDYASVNQEYQVLKDKFDGKLTENQLLNGIKQGMANAANDPYTNYFTASEARAFNRELNNSFSGIGAELSQNSKSQIIIMSPIKGSPAAMAGLQPKDIIAKINGKSTAGMSMNQVVDSIRGKAGTTVSLAIIRGSKEFSVSIKRAKITVPSVSYKLLKNNIFLLLDITITSYT